MIDKDKKDPFIVKFSPEKMLYKSLNNISLIIMPSIIPMTKRNIFFVQNLTTSGYVVRGTFY
jgi:hypothetical protein